MKKIKFVITVLNNNISSVPSAKAEEEARMHFTLQVQNAGSGQMGSF